MILVDGNWFVHRRPAPAVSRPAAVGIKPTACVPAAPVSRCGWGWAVATSLPRWGETRVSRVKHDREMLEGVCARCRKQRRCVGGNNRAETVASLGPAGSFAREAENKLEKFGRVVDAEGTRLL